MAISTAQKNYSIDEKAMSGGKMCWRDSRLKVAAQIDSFSARKKQ